MPVRNRREVVPASRFRCMNPLRKPVRSLDLTKSLPKLLHQTVEPVARNPVRNRTETGGRRIGRRAVWSVISAVLLVMGGGFVVSTYFVPRPPIPDGVDADPVAEESPARVWEVPLAGTGEAPGARYAYARQEDSDLVVFQGTDGGSPTLVEVARFPDFTADSFLESSEYQAWPIMGFAPSRGLLVYVGNDGLNLYDLNHRKGRPLIRKQQEAQTNVGLPARWSLKGLEGVFALTNPVVSPDGEYVAMTEIRGSDTACGILRISTAEYFSPKDGMGKSPACLNMVWGRDNVLVDAEFGVEFQGRLWVVRPDDFSTVTNLSDRIGIRNADFYEATLAPDGATIAFLYKDTFDTEDNILALAKLDGSGSTILNDEGIKETPFFSEDGRVIYAVESLPEKQVLVAYGPGPKERAVVAALPENFNYWEDPEWIGDGRLGLVGKISDPLKKIRENNARLVIFDLKQHETVAVSDPFYEFLGFSE